MAEEGPDPKRDVWRPGMLFSGKYEVLSCIGRGGMGAVLAARHLELDTTVAIKVMHRDALDDETSSQRFMREARAAARLKSDHAVRIYDVDRIPPGVPYMVMELLEGTDLATAIREQEPSIGEAVDWIIQASSAIQEAHAIGLVHRDLKPNNLFLARLPDGATRLKVLDFGLVKDVSQVGESWLTSTSGSTEDVRILGSPHFMSPEQIRDPSSVDARSDVWSLGATLHCLLTGVPPFSGTTTHVLLALILTDPPADVRAQRADVPDEIARVIARCLEKDPERRFETAAALGQALAAWRKKGPHAQEAARSLAPRSRKAAPASAGEETIEVQDKTLALVAPAFVAPAPAPSGSRKVARSLIVAAASALAIIVLATVGLNVLRGGAEARHADTKTDVAPSVSPVLSAEANEPSELPAAPSHVQSAEPHARPPSKGARKIAPSPPSASSRPKDPYKWAP